MSCFQAVVHLANSLGGELLTWSGHLVRPCTGPVPLQDQSTWADSAQVVQFGTSQYTTTYSGVLSPLVIHLYLHFSSTLCYLLPPGFTSSYSLTDTLCTSGTLLFTVLFSQFIQIRSVTRYNPFSPTSISSPSRGPPDQHLAQSAGSQTIRTTIINR